MEDMLELLIVVFGLVAAIANSASKNKKKSAKSDGSKPEHPYGAAPAAPAPAAPVPAKASMAEMLPKQEPVQTMMPIENVPAIPHAQVSVHAHVEPDCETHDAPGSLGFLSTEGKDPCHEDQMQPRRIAEDEVQEGPGLTLEWSGEGLVKAFVMQEVLTRPCQRRAAR